MRPGSATTKRTWPTGAAGSPGCRSSRVSSPSTQSTFARTASKPVTSLASSASLPPPSRAPTSIAQGWPSRIRTCTYEGPVSSPTARLALCASSNSGSSFASSDG